VIDCAQGHTIEGRGEGFRATRVHLGWNAGDADGFLEECGFLAPRLGKRHSDFGSANGNGNSWKACSGAVVEEGPDPNGERLCAGNGFDEVALKDSLGVANGGEIGAGVPALEQSEKIYKLFIFFYLKRCHARSREQLGEALRRVWLGVHTCEYAPPWVGSVEVLSKW
jgi:hypothetical protein